MKKLTRIDKITEIYKIATAKNLNISTVVFVLASMTDKALTKFYNELKEKHGEIKT